MYVCMYIYAGTVSEYMCAKYTRVAHIKRMIQVCKGICGQTDSEICQTCLPRNLNNAVFFADDEFDDSASGNRAASSSSEDPVRSLGAHLRGTCQPCVFNATTAGCSKGDYCGYCHFDHPMTMLNRRVRKRTRDKIKRRLLEIFNPPVDLENQPLFKIKTFRLLVFR